MPDDLKERIRRYLQTEVAQALAIDGAAIDVLDVSDGIAQVRFGAACAGCPATILSLVTSLEQEIRQRFPEVRFLEAVP